GSELGASPPAAEVTPSHAITARQSAAPVARRAGPRRSARGPCHRPAMLSASLPIGAVPSTRAETSARAPQAILHRRAWSRRPGRAGARGESPSRQGGPRRSSGEPGGVANGTLVVPAGSGSSANGAGAAPADGSAAVHVAKRPLRRTDGLHHDLRPRRGPAQAADVRPAAVVGDD